MSLSLILSNARLANASDASATVDIAIADGRITAIEPRISGGGTRVDAGGRFVSSGLVESHFHLDKSRILDRVAPLEDRRVTDYMKRTSAVKDTFTVEDVYARARDTLEQCLLNGVMHMRTHIEVDAPIGLRGYEAIERLAKDYAWGMDLQLCVFLQEGWTNVPGAESTVVQALKRGATVVGGAPRYDADGAAQIRRIFALAKDFNVDVDIHGDGGYTTDDMMVWQICDLTDRMGWGGRVAIGHGNKYSCLTDSQVAALGKRLADSGVAVSVLPATDIFTSGRHMEHSVMRGLADANALVAQGANCSIATNNVLNPFTPYGDCSLVRIANMYANVVQRGTEKDLSECFAMVTDRPARILRKDDYGIAVGNPADLVVWNAKTPAEVIATVAQPVMGFKRGRRVFTREMPTLHRP
ncbi:MAG: amidohydrolase [Betaproteobacteria bacterium]|nr:amidohydrolase [Betaproteobacteria bacterium]MEA3158285.1 cytosine/creatinine deaminase [Betaproteobacteria bacterium]